MLICSPMTLHWSSMPLHGGIDLNLHRKCNDQAKKHWIKYKPTPSSGNSRSTSPRLNGNGYIDECSFQHSLSLLVNIVSNEHPCSSTLVITSMNVSHSVNIARGCSKKSKRTLLSWNTRPNRKHHQREREISSLKPSFNLICKWCTWSGQCYRSVQLKKSKRKIDSCLVSFTIGGMQPMTKCDGYQTTRQQNQKHSATFVDSSIKLQRPHLSFSRITFWVKPCLCIYECTSMNNHSLMLYLEEDSTSISGSGWSLLWTKNENAILIVYRTCWTKNTKNELRKERKRDWKSGLIVDFPIIMISDQNKSTHTHTHTHIRCTRLKHLNSIWKKSM